MGSTATEKDFAAVVVAAGTSTRLPGPVPKQFLELARKSVLQRSVTAMLSCPAVHGVVVVLSSEHASGERGAEIRGWPGVLDVVAGGATRSESVLAGLQSVGSAAFVLVHDAARPAVRSGLVDRVVQATRIEGAAIPVIELADTVKQVDSAGRIERTLDRARLRRAQTPQGFRTDLLIAALERVRQDRVPATDEAAALEYAGHPVSTVVGDPGNRKITSSGDLAQMRLELEGGEMELRCGTGFDIHRFGENRTLVLGGVKFEGHPGLEGHSDADVVLHAAMDALLGAASLGDIGAHFPVQDPRFKDADSSELARHVAGLLEQQGWRIVNLDLTLLAERPRIRDEAANMRARIAASLQIDPGCVGLKATTMEGLGALGRAEGIACQAACLIQRDRA